jgi:hypothetical protein
MSLNRKVISVIILLALASLWFSACASQPSANPAAAPTHTAVVPPAGGSDADTSLATPAVGSARVREIEGLLALPLHAKPDQNSAILGQAKPGDEGKALGVNPEGTWVLVQFAEQTGWVPIPAVEMILVQ